MRLLLDENLDPKLIPLIKSNVVKIEISTVKEMQWLGVKNGKLLSLAEENDFDVFVSMDKNLKYQQNFEKLKITVIVLRAYNNRYSTVSGLISKLISEIESENFISKGKFIEIT